MEIKYLFNVYLKRRIISPAKLAVLGRYSFWYFCPCGAALDPMIQGGVGENITAVVFVYLY